jgi:uncharacterized membrane protein
MTDLFESLAKLLSDFTWKRLLGAVVAVTVLVAMLFMYERYTNSFALDRVQKRAEILQVLQEIRAKGWADDRRLETAYTRLLDELEATAVPDPPSFSAPSVIARLQAPEAVWKFLAGASLWWLVALVALRDVYKGDDSAAAALLALGLGGVIFGTIGALLSSLHWTFNYVAYPILAPTIVIGLLMFIDDFATRVKTNAQRAREAESARAQEGGKSAPTKV